MRDANIVPAVREKQPVPKKPAVKKPRKKPASTGNVAVSGANRRNGKLNLQQERFVKEYLIDLNAAAAARRAGYAEKDCRRTAYNLLQYDHVHAAIVEAQRRHCELLDVDVAYVMRRLKREAEFQGEGCSHSARVRALELLAKRLKMWDNELTVKGSQDDPVQVQVQHDGCIELDVDTLPPELVHPLLQHLKSLQQARLGNVIEGRVEYGLKEDPGGQA